MSDVRRTTERLYDGATYRLEYVHTWSESLDTHTYTLHEYKYERRIWLLTRDGFHAYESASGALERGAEMVRELEAKERAA